MKNKKKTKMKNGNHHLANNWQIIGIWITIKKSTLKAKKKRKKQIF
jgi:hypothetical protein